MHIEQMQAQSDEIYKQAFKKDSDIQKKVAYIQKLERKICELDSEAKLHQMKLQAELQKQEQTYEAKIQMIQGEVEALRNAHKDSLKTFEGDFGPRKKNFGAKSGSGITNTIGATPGQAMTNINSKEAVSVADHNYNY